MDKDAVKNIIILKNLPSNIVEEAFVVVKPSLKVHKLDLIQDMKQIENMDKLEKGKGKEFKKIDIKNLEKENKYVIKEAESVLNSCVENLEKQLKGNYKAEKSYKIKYNRLKKLSFGITSLFLLYVVLSFFI